jgi:SAM-dependent methyltransferase
MRLPLKLNAERLPGWLARVLHAKPSPSGLLRPQNTGTPAARAWHAERVSSLMTGRTWRSTRPGRHRRTDGLLLEMTAQATDLVVLDVGISDGITALELIERLEGRFTEYWATDMLLKVRYAAAGGRTRFYDGQGRCLLVAGRWLLAYPQDRGVSPLHWLAHSLAKGGEGSAMNGAAGGELSLVQPELLARSERDPRIRVAVHDVFEPWRGSQPGLVKVGNLFNLAYFTAAAIQRAAELLGRALRPGGLFVIVENRAEEERSSVLVREGRRFRLERTIGEGAEAAGLIVARCEL